MVCVAVKGRPIIGVIHNPFLDKTTWAWVGNTKSEDLLKIKRDDSNYVKNSIYIVSRSHTGEVKQYAKKIFGENINIITAAGAGKILIIYVYKFITIKIKILILRVLIYDNFLNNFD